MGTHEQLAAARRCRREGRVSRARENSARRAAGSLEASIVLGGFHAAYAVRRSGLHRQTGADVDSVLWLVSLESRSGAGGPQGEGRRDGRNDRKRARSARRGPADHHLSGRHAHRAGRAARLQGRVRQSLCGDERAVRACRAQFRPVLAAPQIPALSRHDRAGSARSDPARASTGRHSRRACSRRSRPRWRGFLRRGSGNCAR